MKAQIISTIERTDISSGLIIFSAFMFCLFVFAMFCLILRIEECKKLKYKHERQFYTIKRLKREIKQKSP